MADAFGQELLVTGSAGRGCVRALEPVRAMTRTACLVSLGGRAVRVPCLALVTALALARSATGIAMGTVAASAAQTLVSPGPLLGHLYPCFLVTLLAALPGVQAGLVGRVATRADPVGFGQLGLMAMLTLMTTHANRAVCPRPMQHVALGAVGMSFGTLGHQSLSLALMAADAALAIRGPRVRAVAARAAIVVARWATRVPLSRLALLVTVRAAGRRFAEWGVGCVTALAVAMARNVGTGGQAKLDPVTGLALLLAPTGAVGLVTQAAIHVTVEQVVGDARESERRLRPSLVAVTGVALRHHGLVLAKAVAAQTVVTALDRDRV